MAELMKLPSLNEALGSLQDELIRLKGTVDLLNQNKEATLEVVRAAIQVNDAVIQLSEPTKALVDQIAQVDFPVKLNNIFKAISAFGASFQTLQEAIDVLDRTINSSLSNINDGFKQLSREVSQLSNYVGSLQVTFQEVQNRLSVLEQNVKDSIKSNDSGFQRLDHRVDKLEAVVNTLHSGIQTLQGRFESLERNVKDDIRGINSEVKRFDETIQDLDESIQDLDESVDSAADANGKLINHQANKIMKLVWVILFFLIVNIGITVFFILSPDKF